MSASQWGCSSSVGTISLHDIANAQLRGLNHPILSCQLALCKVSVIVGRDGFCVEICVPVWRVRLRERETTYVFLH